MGMLIPSLSTHRVGEGDNVSKDALRTGPLYKFQVELLLYLLLLLSYDRIMKC